MKTETNKANLKSVQNPVSEAKKKRTVKKRLSEGTRNGAPVLELYQKEDCPFSQLVRAKISNLGLDFISHSVPDGDSLKHKKLVEAGGKDQIPFLHDHSSGTKLYDSEAIIEFLDKQFGNHGSIPASTEGLDHLGGRVLTSADRITQLMRHPGVKAKLISQDLSQTWGVVRGSFLQIKRRLTANP